MEVTRLGIKSELQQSAYTTATVMGDPYSVCDLHHSSRQDQILKIVSDAKDQTWVFKDTSWVCYC